MRLIDADKLPFSTVGICDAQENFYGFAEVTFAEDIETAPTVDAVPIVRCKECEHCQGLNSHLFCNIHSEYTNSEFFCASGKQLVNGVNNEDNID